MGDMRKTRPITSQDSRTSADLMCRAIALALENVRCARGGPFAALVAKDGNVIGEGANSVTSTNDPTAHAEIVAIRSACRALGSFQLTDCDLYTTCEPCPMCLGAIYWARPTRVFYAGVADAADAGFDDALIYEELQRPPGSRRIPMIPLMREESLTVFAAWKQQPNKTKY
jgi:guanine deaminase